MAEGLGDEAWFHQAGVLLNDRQPDQLTQAVEDLKAVNEIPTPAALSLPSPSVLDRNVRTPLRRLMADDSASHRR
jgi:hypothetical protein